MLGLADVKYRRENKDPYGRKEFRQVLSDCFGSPADACNAEDDIVDFVHPPQVALVELLVGICSMLSLKVVKSSFAQY